MERLYQIEDVRPRAKILFINPNPKADSIAHLNIARHMFGLEQDIEPPEMVLSRIKSPGPSDSGNYFLRHSVKAEIELPKLDDVSAVVISGSTYNAGPLKRKMSMFGVERPVDKPEWFVPFWLRELIEFVQQAHEAGKPILGECFGAQVLAEALGGKIGRLVQNGQGVKEGGWGVVDVADSQDPLFANIAPKFVAPMNHMYQVVNIPPSSHAIAEGRFGVQAFRIDNAWGIQFHPAKEASAVESYYAEEGVKDKYAAWGWNIEQEQELGKKHDPKTLQSIYTNFLRLAWVGVQ